MDSIHCTLCVNKCMPKEVTVEETPTAQGHADQDDQLLKCRLQVIYLLRKVLEIPQDICCIFLKNYGDPSTWINCCDSCVLLLENSKQLFDQMLRLEKQLQTVKNQIKDQISRAIPLEEALIGESQFIVKETMRSFISEGTLNSIPISELEEAFIDNIPSSYQNSMESIDDEAANYNTNELHADSVCVKVENDDDFFVYPPLDVVLNEAAGHQFEEDPLLMGGRDDINHHHYEINDDGGLPIQRQQTFQSIAAKFFSEANFNAAYSHNNYKSEHGKDSKPGTSKTTNEPFRIRENKKSYVYKCNICSRFYKDVKAHKELRHRLIVLKCGICGKTFCKDKDLVKHQKIHIGKIPTYKCEKCGEEFLRYTDWNVHRKCHNRILGPYHCEMCGKSFVKTLSLENHQRTHSQRKAYKCETCGEGFTKFTALARHKRSRHNKDKTSKPYKCDICGETFAILSGVRYHKLTHTGKANPSECPNNEFPEGENLEGSVSQNVLENHEKQASVSK